MVFFFFFFYRLCIFQELQLTKLAHATTKVVKRVAPSVSAKQQADGKSGSNQNTVVSSPTQSVTVSVPPQRQQPRTNAEKRKPEVSNSICVYFFLPFLKVTGFC